jgi:hypothetical protein
MPSGRTIALVLILSGGLGCAGGRAPSPRGASAGPATALELLQLRQPQTKWDPKSLLKADLDQDGGEDFALLGRRKDRFVVGVVQGPVNAEKSAVWTLDFPWNGGEDALCSQHAKIALEPLAENEGPEADHPQKGLGINLSDDLCDAFHIYWSQRQQRFEWWRL